MYRTATLSVHCSAQPTTTARGRCEAADENYLVENAAASHEPPCDGNGTEAKKARVSSTPNDANREHVQAYALAHVLSR